MIKINECTITKGLFYGYCVHTNVFGAPDRKCLGSFKKKSTAIDAVLSYLISKGEPVRTFNVSCLQLSLF